MAALITFTSDYGLSDHYVAAVKGIVWSELPEANIVDITHNIGPANFFEAAFIIRNSYASFPKGTVHIIAVNELVKSGKVLAITLDGHFFLCSDNGMAGLINPDIKIGKVVQIDFKQEFSLFPARDIMARAACHLARGGSTDVLGRTITDYQKSSIMRPRVNQEGNSILGSVVYVDNFGNLITNISQKKFQEVRRERSFDIVLPRNTVITEIMRDYNQLSNSRALALFNSQQLLEIAVSGSMGKVFNGANTLLGVKVGDTVTVNFK